MADDAKEAAERPADDEKFDIEEPDIETASDDDLEDQGRTSKRSTNVLIGLALAAAAGAVFGASFFVGKKATVTYRTSAGESSHASPAQPGNESAAKAVVSKKSDEAISGELKSEPGGAAQAKKPDPTAVEREKALSQFMEKEILPAAKKNPDPVAAAERPSVPLPQSSPQIKRPATPPATAKQEVKPTKPAPVKKEVAKKEKAGKEYRIIAGAFSVKENAEALAGQLKAKNYNPSIVRAKTAKGTLYRVVAGSYRSMDVTKTKIGELKKLGFKPFYIFE